MTQKHRIYTDIGVDQKITVELNQDFGLLEVLSLKMTQKDVYASLCSDYGVVCGRISINNGYGVPNVRVSIFIPLLDSDAGDPVITALYPFTSTRDVNPEGFRYNLLPDRKQHGGHEPTGSFPDQLDILTREEVLEVYEKYYKYTVKTNNSGDFMIWGVPVGPQVIHVDVDFSDIGCFSLRPADFLEKGYGLGSFKSSYEFKSAPEIDSLPQIQTFDKSIEVYPFWGDTNMCEIGITRVDFDLSSTGLVIEPKAVLIGGSFTDTGKHSISKHCEPKKFMGSKCTLTSESGKIEMIRFTSKRDTDGRPILEEYKSTDGIEDDGAFIMSIPMNMDYLYTNEFGENEYTNDPNKGIPTSCCARLRFSINSMGTERLRTRASYLVPNIREFNDDLDSKNKSYAWSTNYDAYPINSQELILNARDGFYYPQDYFYRFQYGKVYTLSSFQNTLFVNDVKMLGINDIAPTEDKDCDSSIVTPPANFGIKKRGSFSILLGSVIAFLYYAFNLIFLLLAESIGTIFKKLSNIININILGAHPLKGASEYILNAAYKIQGVAQLTLPLTIYDDCEPCPVNDDLLGGGSVAEDYCKIGEFKFDVEDKANSSILHPFETSTFFFMDETNYGTSYFDPNENVIDCSETNTDCCNPYALPILAYDNQFTQLNYMTITNPDGSVTPRFKMILGVNNSQINEVSFYISDDDSYGEVCSYIMSYVVKRNSYLMGFEFNRSKLNEFFGITEYRYFDFSGDDLHYRSEPIYAYIVDLSKQITSEASYTPAPVTLEEGCQMYDTLYNEATTQSYLWFKGSPAYDPAVPAESQQINTDDIKELVKTEPSPGADWSIGASVWYKRGQGRMPGAVTFQKIPSEKYDRKTKTGYSEFRDGVFYIVPSIDGISAPNQSALREWYRRQIVGLNFCGGIVNYAFIDNWLSGSLYFFQFKAKMKKPSRLTTALITITTGPLYVISTLVFPYKKMCEDLIYYESTQERFYYRSCPYLFYKDQWGLSGKSTDPADLKILHPTTFVDLGPRDEFIKDICLDPSLDPNSSVSRSISPTSFKSFGELVAFSINYKLDIRQGEAKIDEFFTNEGFMKSYGPLKFFNGDIVQLVSINNEAGIEGFDLTNQKYLGYNLSTLDPETNVSVFKKDGVGEFGPVPITLKYDDDGVRIRESLNAPPFLTESAQRVPFYLWDKKALGFGSYDLQKRDNQSWDYSTITVEYLQGMTRNYKFSNGNDQYLLPPISYDFTGLTVTGLDSGLPEEFDEIIDVTLIPVGMPDSDVLQLYDKQHHGFRLLLSTSGDTITGPLAGRLYIRLGNTGQWAPMIDWNTKIDYSIFPTLDTYTSQKQILSTPFLFYFGLRPGKTGIDKLIENYGPMGAFPFTE